MNSYILISLLISHIICDFFLQTDKLCEKKNIKTPHLYLHGGLHGIMALFFSLSFNFLPYAALIFITHTAIDLVKIKFGSKNSLHAFIIDQMAHIGIIILVSVFYHNECLFEIIHWPISHLLFILAFLLCLKPANILIKLILAQSQKTTCKDDAETLKAGALIGNLERILTLVLVVAGCFEIIGFIIATKSILRFKDTETAKTEYLLAGTLLSFGIAIILGLIICKL